MCSIVVIFIWICILLDEKPNAVNVSAIQLDTPTFATLLKVYGMIAFQFDIHPMLMTIEVDMEHKHKIGNAVCYGITGMLFFERRPWPWSWFLFVLLLFLILHHSNGGFLCGDNISGRLQIRKHRHRQRAGHFAAQQSLVHDDISRNTAAVSIECSRSLGSLSACWGYVACATE